MSVYLSHFFARVSAPQSCNRSAADVAHCAASLKSITHFALFLSFNSGQLAAVATLHPFVAFCAASPPWEEEDDIIALWRHVEVKQTAAWEPANI